MNPAEFVIATLLAQGLAALVLAGLFWMFLRSLEHHFLRQLALAFTALSLHLGFSAISLLLLTQGSVVPGLKESLLFAEIMTFLAFLAWLVMGMRSGLEQKPIAPEIEQRVLGATVLAGAVIGAGWMLVETSSAGANILRISIPYGIAAIVFLHLGLHMNRVRQGAPGLISPVLGTAAFVLASLLMIYSSAVNLAFDSSVRPMFHAPFLSLISLMNLGLIGLSIVIWLLENERERTRTARVKALSAEQRLLYFRTHDAATGLPNQRQVENLLSQEILLTRSNPHRRVAILALGIHRFKAVSEAVGWHRTEDMMRDLTRRIRDKLPERFVLARTGERDFIILMPNIRRRQDAVGHAEKILARLRLPFHHDKQELFLKVSGGMSIGPDHSDDAAVLLNQAHRAQLQSASAGAELIQHQASSMESGPADLIHREAELRQACRDGQFIVHFQPLISIRKRSVAGFEALLRWNHPTRGILTPDHFLQDAVSLGVLDEMEDQIFAQVLDQLAEWHRDLALAPVSVSINISADRFQQPDLPDKLVDMCRVRGISPGYVDLELTESAAITDFEAGLDSIQRLREQGFKISLDDFGTGYSSLAHLQRLRVDYVKLDRSFVQGIEHDHQQLALTRAIVELIHSLGMEVLAEGVETRSQLGHLLQCRVDYVQGYLLGRPQPAKTYQTLLEQKFISSF
ncbi:MAG: bifunctional diguanylate cyclase/phosphodiesterase [Wenzhouxiangella sp.]|nr:bifunctional diguanylate cyclase/phosphodiesterase [Wenzhouxiangella sp.]